MLFRSKYPASGTAIANTYGTGTYDTAPLGAFGGLGVIQLMTPPGPVGPGEVVDNTNTVLDDRIRVIKNGVSVIGADKKSLLAWRGFPNTSGTLVDDSGVATNIGANEGEIRPSPVLLPVPFSSKSRLRSKWIDTGASVRRPLTATDGLPRGIVETTDFRTGPTYQFAGLNTQTGYVDYSQTGGESVRINYPSVTGTEPIDTNTISNVTYQGQPAYSIQLVNAEIGRAHV